jgi:hypothetical protein
MVWPVERLDSSEASLTRWASPPESVVRRLAEADVAQARRRPASACAGDHRLVLEELERLLDGMSRTSAMFLPLNWTVEGVAVVAGALADLARHVHVGQEVHLDLDGAVARAGLAAAALDVEAEAPGQVAADLGLGGLGEQLADVVEHAGVGGRVGARGAADGRLVDVDDLVEVLEAGDPLVQPGGSSTVDLAASASGAGCR